MMRIKNGYKHIGMIALVLAGALSACRNSSKNSDAALSFSHDDLYQFQGADQTALSIRPVPVYGEELATQRGAVGEVKDYYFRLKFYRVVYQMLKEKVNGSFEGDVTEVIDTHREMVISRDNIAGGNLKVKPVFDNGDFLVDGFYVIVMCRNLTACAAPSAAALTKYKNMFQDGQCVGANDTVCKRAIMNDSAATNPFLGIAYPINVANKKFTSGDNDLVYIAASTQVAGLALAEANQATEVFESSGGGYEPAADSSESPNGLNTGNSTGSSKPADSNASFWDGVGKTLIWLNSVGGSSGGDHTAANNAAIAASNAAAAQSAAASFPAAARSNDCFVAGSRIAVVSFTQDGAVDQIGEKDVENIVVGDYVYNPLLRSAFLVKTVYQEENHDAIYTIEVKSDSPQLDERLTVSAAHPVITKVGVKPVALLEETDKILMVNKVPVTSKTDYSWFAVKKLLRTTTPGTIKIYNLDIDSKAIKIGANPNEAWWYYAVSKDATGCAMEGCSENFLSSNKIVTGDLAKQQTTEKLLQRAFVEINNSKSP